MGKPWAMVAIERFCQPDQWVTARELARRMNPAASDFVLSVDTKTISRHLANSARDGHLLRRETSSDVSAVIWEYAIPSDFIRRQLAESAQAADPTRAAHADLYSMWWPGVKAP